jgi:SSS family solute:Na+ symporter
MTILVWPAVPLVFACVVPLYSRLELETVYEYLELRFSGAVRAAAAATFVVWQIVWLPAVLCLPARLLGLDAASYPLVVGAGALATVIAMLGGMKGVVRTDAMVVLVMIVATLAAIAAVQAGLDGRADRAFEVADTLGRNRLGATAGGSSAAISAWTAALSVLLLPLFFLVADQSTVARLLSARDERRMKQSVVAGSTAFGLMILASTYVGVGMLAIYHDNANAEMRPQWIVNRGRDPATGRPLIGPDTPIDRETIGDLVARGAILDPNTNRPMTGTEDLLDAEGRVNIDRLATREVTGERRLRAGRNELFARFVARHLGPGWAGLVAAAMLLAAVAVVDSGLLAVAAVMTVDFHRRLGWGGHWLAARTGKTPAELDDRDELRLARPLVLASGMLVTSLALAAGGIGDVWGYVLAVLGVFAGPLLGIYVLGLFTRRTTSTAALCSLLGGMAAAAWLSFKPLLGGWPALAWAWPRQVPYTPAGPFLAGLAATLVSGYLLSFLAGERKSREELAGLVAGLGPWGHIVDPAEEHERRESSSPWSQ